MFTFSNQWWTHGQCFQTYLNSIIKIMLLINRTDELKPITEPYRHLPGKSAHLQTVTGHFSNTDLRDVVDMDFS